MICFSCEEPEGVPDKSEIKIEDLTGKLRSISYSYNGEEYKNDYLYTEKTITEVIITDLIGDSKISYIPTLSADSIITSLISTESVKTFKYNNNSNLEEIKEQDSPNNVITTSFTRETDGKLSQVERFTIDDINKRKTTLLKLNYTWEAGSLTFYSILGKGIPRDDVTVTYENSPSKAITACISHGVFLPLIPFTIPYQISTERPLFTDAFYQHVEKFNVLGQPTQYTITNLTSNEEVLNIILTYF